MGSAERGQPTAANLAKRRHMTLVTTTKTNPGAGFPPTPAVASGSATPAQTAPRVSELVPFAGWTAARLRDLKSCQQWLKSLVDPPVERLFAAFTGLAFCLAWNAPFTAAHRAVGNGFCPRLRCLRRGADWIPAQCAACRRRYWEHDPRRGPGRRRFRGLCGAPTLWIDFCMDGVKVGRFVLQSLAQPSGAVPHPPDFRRAIRLLRVLIVQVGARLENQRLREELVFTRRLVAHLQVEIDRLRRELHQWLPELPAKTLPPGRAAHAECIVDRMLGYVREHCRKPMSLGEVAQALDMNASYLSTLFAHTTGLTFHAYLDELRLAKAKELLRDPTLPVAQVACECGYASDDWFRHAFKAKTGMSPSAWRWFDRCALESRAPDRAA